MPAQPRDTALLQTRPPNAHQRGLITAGRTWLQWPPPQDRGEVGWWWLRDAVNYRVPVVVHLGCNQKSCLGICWNELHDSEVDWRTAEVIPCRLP